MVMKFADKCPKCGGSVQTKSLRKSIGLGFVDIPVAQFCLDPRCDWYQDFSESKEPEDIRENVLQIKIPAARKSAFQVRNLAFIGTIAAALIIVFIYSSISQPQQLPSLPAGGAGETPAPDVNTKPVYTHIPTPIATAVKEAKKFSMKIDVSHGFYPGVLTINRSEIVVWSNEENQRARIVLESREGLFGNRVMQYSDKFSYQFNLSGTYTFFLAEYPSFKVYPGAEGKVLVK